MSKVFNVYLRDGGCVEWEFCGVHTGETGEDAINQCVQSCCLWDKCTGEIFQTGESYRAHFECELRAEEI